MKKASLALLACAAGLPIFAMADPAAMLEKLRADLTAARTGSEAIVAAADDEGRDLTPEELKDVEAFADKIKGLQRQIDARSALVPQGSGRRTSAEPANKDGIIIPAQARTNDGRMGFRSFGEFAQSVRNHARQRYDDDGVKRLMAAQTTLGNEGTGADGGFAVPPDFRQSIWVKVMDQENLLTRCDQLETASNSMTYPKDETTPWDTTNGIQVNWEGEGQAPTVTKPQLQMATIRLAKLMALVPISDELLDDAPGLESWLRAKAPAKMQAKINTAIISGTGVGQPLGILNAKSLITISAETSQATATIYFANIQKMWARLYAPCRRNAVWLINQDVEPQLNAMAFDPKATSKVPAYMPPGGLSESPYGLLMSRPVVPVEACSTIGTAGDIILADLTQYMALKKAGQDIRTDVSMHLYFDQALMAFRFIFRVNGQPYWGDSMSPKNGSNTRSWAVALATRP